jgi:CTP synthase
VELRDHPWFVASQFHPEFLSRPHRPHPLFRDFLGAAIEVSGIDQMELGGAELEVKGALGP